MAKKAPGKAHREGITLVQLMDMFPTEESDDLVRVGHLGRRTPLREVWEPPERSALQGG